MQRKVVFAVALLLVTQFAFAAATKTVVISGNYSGGAKVSATCTISSTGLVSGVGKFEGPGFSYPFTVKKVTSGAGTVTLSGNFTIASKPPITLTAAVPSGNQTFKYVLSGKTATYSGTGTVTVQ